MKTSRIVVAASAVLLLAIWIGIGFIFRGVATAVSAISDPDTPGRGWEIFVGVITLIAGIVVLASPFPSLATLTLVVGIWLLANIGAATLALPWAVGLLAIIGGIIAIVMAFRVK